jgi:hypothetical protein
VRIEFVRKKLDLGEKWPVVSNTWKEDSWNNTEYHRFNVDFFIDTDIKNTTRRALYVSFVFFFCTKLELYYLI